MSINNRRKIIQLAWQAPAVTAIALPMHAQATSEVVTTQPPLLANIIANVTSCADLLTNKDASGFTYQMFATPRGVVAITDNSFAGSVDVNVNVVVTLLGQEIYNESDIITLSGTTEVAYELASYNTTADGGDFPHQLVETITLSSADPFVVVSGPASKMTNVTSRDEVISGALQEVVVFENGEISTCVP